MKLRIIIFTLVLALLLSGIFLFVAKPTPSQVGIAKTAPLWTASTITGTRLSLADLLKTHHLVLLNFWASWCGVCQKETPALIAVQETFKNNLIVIGVNEDGKLDEAKKFAQGYGVTYPIIMDNDQQIMRIYGFSGLPSSVLINQDGKIVWAQEGELSAKELRGVIEKAGQ
jgi:thiol-disulfide isomerase/thioredoxin